MMMKQFMGPFSLTTLNGITKIRYTTCSCENTIISGKRHYLFHAENFGDSFINYCSV